MEQASQLARPVVQAAGLPAHERASKEDCPVAITAFFPHIPCMSVAQVTQAIARMTEDEQFHVAAFIQHLVDVRDPNHAAAIADANHRMDSGQKVTFEKLIERHEALEREGK